MDVEHEFCNQSALRVWQFLSAMIRYIVTSHTDRPGVRLSKAGHWGNLPFDTEEEAREYAEDDARKTAYSIESERVRQKLHEVA